jgi:predicted AlkP superfamily pyrophosphatase or phosphodiesterase
MRINLIALIAMLSIISATAQNTGNPGVNATAINPKRPKLVVGIVIDQMRWDYMYRYMERYAPNGGFKRLLNAGFSCDNAMIPYTPSLTACGHTCIYTGSVPAINGITGNDWWNYRENRFDYCTGDDLEKSVGSNDAEGQMSPRNLLVTTIGDELKLATNFQSKVIGIALKDRGAILPAGHSANAAYWYDSKTGDWITSSYYENTLPAWVNSLNAKKLPDHYYSMNWSTLYPTESYIQSNNAGKSFSSGLAQYAGKNYQVIAATPYGNNLTLDMAEAAIAGEELGADSITDLLTISFSSPDYIGHAYGPNSVQTEDCFLRLDKTLGELLDFLDKQVGTGKYLAFLTADHGAANVPAFLKEHKIPAGNFDNEKVTASLNKALSDEFKSGDLVIGILNYQVYLNRNVMAAKRLNKDNVYAATINFLAQDSSVERVFALEDLSKTTLNSRIRESVENGYYPDRSGDIQIVLRPQWIDGFLTGGTTHGLWNPYDTHIPLIWFGWNVVPGRTTKNVYMTDIAPTIAAILRIQMPDGSVGNVIQEVIK